METGIEAMKTTAERVTTEIKEEIQSMKSTAEHVTTELKKAIEGQAARTTGTAPVQDIRLKTIEAYVENMKSTAETVTN